VDPLERLATPARDLFARVDTALAHAGAPDTHPIWPLLRRVGALPGDAAAAVLALRPGELARAAPPLRGLAEQYDRAAQTGTTASPSEAGMADGGWSGSGAEAFTGHWTSLAGHLAGADESLAGRLRETAGYAEAVADWMTDTRTAVAVTVVEALGSTEAVTLVTAGRPGSAFGGGAWPGTEPPVSPEVARAAAALGARVLAVIDEAYDAGERVRAAWSGRLVELAYRPPTPDGPPPPNALRVPI
jgi:hypothetical protein